MIVSGNCLYSFRVTTMMKLCQSKAANVLATNCLFIDLLVNFVILIYEKCFGVEEVMQDAFRTKASIKHSSCVTYINDGIWLFRNVKVPEFLQWNHHSRCLLSLLLKSLVLKVLMGENMLVVLYMLQGRFDVIVEISLTEEKIP